MPDQNEQAMNDLATGIAADHKEEKRQQANATKQTEEFPETDHVGPRKPLNAEPGDTWRNTEDNRIRHLHTSGRWYLKPEEVEEQDVDQPTAAEVTEVAETAEAAQAAAQISAATSGTQTETSEYVEDKNNQPADNNGSIELNAKQEIDVADDEDDDIPPAFNPADFDFEIEPGQLVPDIRDMMLQRHKEAPALWVKMTENQQRDWAERIRQDAEDLVRTVFEFAAAGGTNAIRCKLDGYSEKKGGLVATISIEEFKEEDSAKAVLFLHKQRGKHVMLRAADIEDYKGNREAATMPDQPEIDFDPDIPEDEVYHGDDADLADDQVDEFDDRDDDIVHQDLESAENGDAQADDFEATEEELAQQAVRPSTEAAQVAEEEAAESAALDGDTED